MTSNIFIGTCIEEWDDEQVRIMQTGDIIADRYAIIGGKRYELPPNREIRVEGIKIFLNGTPLPPPAEATAAAVK